MTLENIPQTMETVLIHYVSLFGGERISLTGDCLWCIDKRVSKGHLYALGTSSPRFAGR